MVTFNSRKMGRARPFAIACIQTIVVLFIALADPCQAATITVTGTGDATAVDGVVTLREAIASINLGSNVNADVIAVGTYGTADTIDFNIAGGGVKTITPASALPSISKAVTIDGYSQGVASANTNSTALGSNAVLLINLDLSAQFGSGLNVTAGPTTIRGLALIPDGGVGIFLNVGSDGSKIEGNFIGTNPAGTAAAIANNLADAILVFSSNNVIGGTSPAARNLISGNLVGINLNSGASNNMVEGNLIGTNAAGTAAIPNIDYGLDVVTPGVGNTIGGTTAAAKNVISGNGIFGIVLEGGPPVAAANIVQGNYIGVDVTGLAALGNGKAGVQVGFSSMNNVIGGAAAGAGNVISGNGSTGSTGFPNANVDADGSGSAGTLIQGNLIGPSATGTSSPTGLPPVVTVGIILGNGATAGGTGAGAGNVVAFNPGVGILVPNSGAGGGPPVQNATISSNSIYSNGQLGIDLGGSYFPAVGDGVTPNDLGDADTGANGLQNFPTIASATTAGNVQGSLNSNANMTYRIEFFASAVCDPTGFGEGQTFIGFQAVTTDGSGNATFNVSLPALPAGQPIVTATATDPAGNTSEFSQCLASVGVALPALTINNVSANEGNSGVTPFVFSVALSAASASTVTVNFATADGTATAGSDYVATSGTLTFNPGVLIQTLTVNVNGDTTVEPNETFFVNLSAPTNATIASSQGTGTIVNDDAVPPAVVKFFGAATIPLNGSTSLTFTITNPNASAQVSGVFLNDSLPVGLVVSTPNGLTDGCNGASAVAGSGIIFLNDISLPANTSCTYSVNVTGTTLGTKNNTTDAITSDQGTGGTASASLTVVAVGPPPPAPSVPAPSLQQWALCLLGLLILCVTAGVISRQSRRQ